MQNEFQSPKDILIQLGEDLGIEAEKPDSDEDLTLTLDFEHQVRVSLAADERDLVIFGRIGRVPDENTDLLELLMAANMFWCETNGATLSMNPATRDILMAMRLPERDLTNLAALRRAIEIFTDLQEGWIRDIEDHTNPPPTDDLLKSADIIHP